VIKVHLSSFSEFSFVSNCCEHGHTARIVRLSYRQASTAGKQSYRNVEFWSSLYINN